MLFSQNCFYVPPPLLFLGLFARDSDLVVLGVNAGLPNIKSMLPINIKKFLIIQSRISTFFSGHRYCLGLRCIPRSPTYIWLVATFNHGFLIIHISFSTFFQILDIYSYYLYNLYKKKWFKIKIYGLKLIKHHE